MAEDFFFFLVYCSGLGEDSTMLRRDTQKGLLCPYHDCLFLGERNKGLRTVYCKQA